MCTLLLQPGQRSFNGGQTFGRHNIRMAKSADPENAPGGMAGDPYRAMSIIFAITF
jgi:hypothetical protein